MERFVLSTLILSTLIVRRVISADPCNGQCGINEICKDGECVFLDKATGEDDGTAELSPCSGVHCPFGTICKGGECVKLEFEAPQLKLSNCFGVSCPLDEICIGGRCQPFDLVLTSQTTTGGECKCPFGWICNKFGECVELTIKAPDFLLDVSSSSSCARTTCSFPDVCYNGICSPLQFTTSGIPCFHVKCAKNEICVDGECIIPTILANTDEGTAINPCTGVRCPWSQVCVGGVCEDLFIKAPEFDDPDNRCNDIFCSLPDYCVTAKCVIPIFSGPNDYNADDCKENCASFGAGWVCRDGQCVFDQTSAHRELSKLYGDGLDNNNEPKVYFNGYQITIIIVFIGIIGVILAVSILVFAATVFMKFCTNMENEKVIDLAYDAEKQPLQ